MVIASKFLLWTSSVYVEVEIAWRTNLKLLYAKFFNVKISGPEVHKMLPHYNT